MLWKRLSALALTATIGTASAGQPSPPSLAEVARAIEARQPATAQSVEAATGAVLRCRDSSCEGGPVELRDVTIGNVDLRRAGGGSILVLERISGSCVPPEAIAADALQALPLNSCTDGATCIYLRVERRWGRLSIGLPGDSKPPRCVESLVFNTLG